MPFFRNPIRQPYIEQATKEFDRLYGMEPIESNAVLDRPVVSTAALEMLSRDAEEAATSSKMTQGGPSEKIRVDLKHLDSASQQASELTATRYRLNSLNDAQLRLTSIRELLDSNSVQLGQLTTALRSFFNHQPQLRKVDNGEDADLERFNDLSAMPVAMGPR